MNILLTNATDIYGGGEFYVLELGRALRDRHHHVTVCCKPDNLLRKKCDQAGIPVIPLAFPPTGRLTHFILRLRNIIRERGIEIVHTNSNYDRTVGAFAAYVSGVKHVTNVHSFHSIQHNVTHWIRNRFATDHFLVDGMCVKDLLVRGDKLSSSKISVIHLGVDPAIMKKDRAARERVRHEFGITPDNVIIGNVGRLVPMKGQEFLVRAFAGIAAEFPEAILFIVGDGELMAPLKKLAQELRIDARTIFAGFRDDLTSVYSAFDIYVHSSVEGGGETFPFAVLQALAEELPVVVTRVGDVPEMVEEGATGYVVPDRDAAAMAHSIARLLHDPNLRKEMAEGSYRRFLRLFTSERMVDRVERLYNAIVRE